MGEIAYQNKDITAKLMAETLKGKSLAPFGLPFLKIVDILPTNLPAIESNELRLDNLFRLNDDSLAMIDYESSFDRENFVKYLNYIARVIKRFAMQNELKNLKKIKMVVIYTADVEQAEEVYDLGGLLLVVEAAYLVRRDSDEIYCRLKRKIESDECLSGEELMELMILPLTVKGKNRKQKVIEQVVDLAKKISDRSEQVRALAGILTFTDKVIDQTYAKKVKEEMQMTLVGQMLIDEGMEKGLEKGIEAFILDNLEEKKDLDQICQKLMKRFSLSQKEADSFLQKYS